MVPDDTQRREVIWAKLADRCKGSRTPLSWKPRKVLGYYIPVGSYPTPFLGYLLFYITDPNHKTRYPKKEKGMSL